MRKFIFVLIAAFSVFSCGTPRLAERSITVGFADYRPYASADFFISPNAYTQEYEPIGELYIEVKPKEEKKFGKPDYFGNSQTYIGQEIIPYQELVDIAVKEAIDKGADGIVNFTISKVTSLSGYVYNISGFCIKRK